MSALRASVEASKGGRPRPSRASRSSNGASASKDLEELSKSELEKRAKKAEIEGRSKMSKAELIDALRSAA
jgi:hypothetical protein